MDESKTMEEGYTNQELASKLLDLVGRERTEGVIFEPVVDRLSQQIKHHANMVPVIKDFIQMETFVGVPGVAPLEGVQYSSLNLAGVPILLNSPYNLDSTVLSSVTIKTFHDLPKSALSQQSDHFVS